MKVTAQMMTAAWVGLGIYAKQGVKKVNDKIISKAERKLVNKYICICKNVYVNIVHKFYIFDN